MNIVAGKAAGAVGGAAAGIGLGAMIGDGRIAPALIAGGLGGFAGYKLGKYLGMANNAEMERLNNDPYLRNYMKKQGYILDDEDKNKIMLGNRNYSNIALYDPKLAKAAAGSAKKGLGWKKGALIGAGIGAAGAGGYGLYKYLQKKKRERAAAQDGVVDDLHEGVGEYSLKDSSIGELMRGAKARLKAAGEKIKSGAKVVGGKIKSGHNKWKNMDPGKRGAIIGAGLGVAGTASALSRSKYAGLSKKQVLALGLADTALKAGAGYGIGKLVKLKRKHNLNKFRKYIDKHGDAEYWNK